MDKMVACEAKLAKLDNKINQQKSYLQDLVQERNNIYEEWRMIRKSLQAKEQCFQCTSPKLRNQLLCRQCYADSIRPYAKKIKHSYSDLSGSCNFTITEILPHDDSTRRRNMIGKPTIRLHNIAHHEYFVAKMERCEFKPIKTWDAIWNKCEDWVPEKLLQKYKGKLRNGILNFTGNRVVAFVEYHTYYYMIEGFWS